VVVALVVVGATAAVSGEAQAGVRAAPSYVRADIVPDGRLAILRARALRIRLRASRPVTVRVSADVRVGSVAARRRPGRALVRARTFRFAHAARRTVRLPLTATGRRVLGDCRTARIVVLSRSRLLQRGARAPARGSKTRKAGITFPPVRFGCHNGQVIVAGNGSAGAHYDVGIATRSISPGADGRFAGQPVYLGGYGLASPPVSAGRPATGILGGGPSVRAIAVSAGARTVAVADIEVQGWFAANRDGPYGLVDIRRTVATQTGGALKASDVVVQSDHTHSGADAMGVWGGVPLEFRRYMFNQTVAAILDAYRHRRPGTLYYGAVDGRDLQSNQFDYDAANQVMDSEVRVLQARDDNGVPFATMLDFSAHATVLGADNTKISGDWPQEANPMLERRFGGDAMTVVATLGRTQPGDRGCSDKSATGDALQLCKLDDYARRVVDRADAAAHAAAPLSGAPAVDARSYLIQDATSSPFLLGLVYAGQAIGAPLNRAITPPWLTGNVLGTTTASLRIGDVLLSVIPGEAYPQIALAVRAQAPGMRGYMTAGLADDQLGYLIDPYTAYPEPIRRTFFDQRGDQLSPVDNDNYAFNVSHTMGERVRCSLLRGAGEVFGHGTSFRDADPTCAPFANDALQAAGADAG
jgi:hypothetical protein